MRMLVKRTIRGFLGDETTNPVMPKELTEEGTEILRVLEHLFVGFHQVFTGSITDLYEATGNPDETFAGLKDLEAVGFLKLEDDFFVPTEKYLQERLVKTRHR